MESTTEINPTDPGFVWPDSGLIPIEGGPVGLGPNGEPFSVDMPPAKLRERYLKARRLVANPDGTLTVI